MVLFVSVPRSLQPQDRRFKVHDTDSADHAAHLARRTALAETVHAMPVRPVLHGDNGATLKATTVLAMLHWLGIEPSCAMGSTVWLQRKCGHRSATQFRSFQRPLRRPEAVAIAPVPAAPAIAVLSCRLRPLYRVERNPPAPTRSPQMPPPSMPSANCTASSPRCRADGLPPRPCRPRLQPLPAAQPFAPGSTSDGA